MKKFIVSVSLVAAVFLYTKAASNPVMVYSVSVQMNELRFNDQGEWIMELRVWVPDGVIFTDTAVKSIRILSHEGIASLLQQTITSPDTIFVITQESLTNPLYIDPYDDYISVETLADGWLENGEYAGLFPFYSYLNYGPSNANNDILSVPANSSISLIDDCSYFYLDSSPTIGFANDTVDGLGQVHGKLYDYYGRVFTNGSFKLKTNLAPYMVFNSDSTFNVVAPAYNMFIFKCYYYPDSTYCFNEEISNWGQCNVIPGATSNFDLHLEYPYLNVGIEDPVSPAVKNIIVAPNPFTVDLQFYIELYHPLKNAEIRIYNLAGREVNKIKLPENKEIRLTLEGSKLGGYGTYIYRLVHMGEVLANGKLSFLR